MYTVTVAGYNSKHPHPFFMSRPNGNPDYLLLIIKTSTCFLIDGEEMIVNPGSALLVRPNVPYQYRSIDGEFKNDWLHFYSDDPDFPDNSGLLFHQPIPLDNLGHISRYFEQLMWERSYGLKSCRCQNVDMIMQLLVSNLLQAIEKKDSALPYSPYSSKLQNLRLTMQSQVYKNFTPAELAASLDISPSYFQHLYKEFFGIPLKTDLINMRIEYAKDLILNTNLKLEQIALMSGYSNEIHFYRQFRQKTRMTPREYLLHAKR